MKLEEVEIEPQHLKKKVTAGGREPEIFITQ